MRSGVRGGGVLITPVLSDLHVTRLPSTTFHSPSGTAVDQGTAQCPRLRVITGVTSHVLQVDGVARVISDDRHDVFRNSSRGLDGLGGPARCESSCSSMRKPATGTTASALHINGGGTSTREDAERDCLSAITFALEGDPRDYDTTPNPHLRRERGASSLRSKTPSWLSHLLGGLAGPTHRASARTAGTE